VAFADHEPVSPAVLDDRLKADASITHVVLIHCETGAGVREPAAEVAAVCERHGKGLIVDAMSSALPRCRSTRAVRFDALVAASGKCLEGVPGMGFVFLRKAILDGCAGHSQSLAMDLHDQHTYMEKTGQWRFTPPTHVVVALAEAITQFVEPKAASPHGWRATPTTAARWSTAWPRWASGPSWTPHQAPIIVTFHAPAHPAYDFKRFYKAPSARGFMLYPGKLTQVETFRVGCIGAIGRLEMSRPCMPWRHAARDGHCFGRTGQRLLPLKGTRMPTTRRSPTPRWPPCRSPAPPRSRSRQRHRRHPARQVPAQGQVPWHGGRSQGRLRLLRRGAGLG
jgi:2-aminoethylphosphonate-pyruvate transaminase